MGWELSEGVKIVQDPNWFGCFDDGMTPEEAIEEANSKGIIERKV